MHDFDYCRPASLDQALAAHRHAADSRYIAGGMALIPVLKDRRARPSTLIDLSALDALRTIERDGDGLIVGALATHDQVARSSVVGDTLPALARLADGIGDPQVRNRGTLGGSVADNDAATDYPAALLALGGTVHTDRRIIAADALFTGPFKTALEDGEIILHVRFPVVEHAAYIKFPRPASNYALVGVFVARTPVAGARVAVTGAGPMAFRHRDLERRLVTDLSAAALEGVTASADGLITDAHGSADYRAHLIVVLTRRAVARIAGT